MTIPDERLLALTYEAKLDDIKKSSENHPFETRTSKVFWRGTPRGMLHNIDTIRQAPRSRLVWASHDYPDYINARYINYTDWLSSGEKGDQYIALMNKTFGPAVDEKSLTKQWVDHKFMACLDGSVGTWGRASEILHSGSILFMHVEHEQFFHKYLKDGEHYIDMPHDLSNLIEKIDMLRANPELCAAISKNGVDFANQVFTHDFMKRYLITLMTGIAEGFEDISEEDFIKLFELENRDTWFMPH